MEVVLTEIRITGIQVLGHTIIPFIWWLFLKRKENFFTWIGLKATENWKLSGVGVLLFFAIIAVSQVFIVPNVMPEGFTAAQQYRGTGMAAFIPAIFFGLKTGVGEEIFWRGFLGKRLCEKFGFQTGNMIQAILFGLLHAIPFFVMLIKANSQTNMDLTFSGILVIALIITIFSGFGGWFLGYLTEKVARGSIIPAILAHGIGNTLLMMAEAFNIL
ncbi:MAG: CPBP family intramembrane glutamic endopeptidase [Bacteroidales bacterium]